MLVLDCGGVFPFRGTHRKMKADISLKAMEMIGYNAMNLAGSDFSFGVDYLQESSKILTFPFLSSNVVTTDGNTPDWLKNHIIKEVGELSVAILGVMPQDAFDELPITKKPNNLKILSPKEGLSRTLSQIKHKTDYVVLLSQLDMQKTATIVNYFDGIDIAISHERRDQLSINQSQEAMVLPCGTKSSNLDVIKLAKKGSSRASILEGEPIDLGDSVPHNAAIDELITGTYFEKLEEGRRLRAEKKRMDLHKSLMEGINKAPEEFIKEQREKDTINRNSAYQ